MVKTPSLQSLNNTFSMWKQRVCFLVELFFISKAHVLLYVFYVFVCMNAESFQMDADTEEKLTETSKTSKDESERPVIENKSRSVLLSCIALYFIYGYIMVFNLHVESTRGSLSFKCLLKSSQ